MCHFVESKLLATKAGIHYLEFEEVRLDALAAYSIKVAMKFESLDDEHELYEVDMYHHRNFYYTDKYLEQVNLEVTNHNHNETIIGIIVRLL